jgi:hypothetical protein
MSNVTAVTHLLPTANEGFITTLGSSISSGATVVPLTDITGLTNGSTFVGIIEPGATNQQVFTGIVDTGGAEITGVEWTRGANVPHTGGVSIVDYITGTAFNMLSRWASIEHNDDGTHSNVTADSLQVTSATTLASLILNGGLTGTGISGQVATYSNSGSAGGTVSWVNLSGLKIAWSTAVATNATIWQTVNLTPVGFINPPIVIGNTVEITTAPGWVEFAQFAPVATGSPQTGGFSLLSRQSTGTNSAATVMFFAIGV